MPRVHKRLIVVLLVALLLFVALPWPAAAQDNTCSNVHRGSLLIPTATTGPPPYPLTGINLQFGNVYVHLAFLDPVGTQSAFYFAPDGGASHLGTEFPDFRLAFIQSNEVIWVGDGPAPFSGTVPGNADEAMVWMRMGPDSPTNPDGNPFGAEFVYGDDCQGPPSWYP